MTVLYRHSFDMQFSAEFPRYRKVVELSLAAASLEKIGDFLRLGCSGVSSSATRGI